MAILTGSLMLGGCLKDRLDDYEALGLSQAHTRHPIGFTARTEALYVEVGGRGSVLSDNQEADVLGFIDRYRKESGGSLRVSAPVDARGALLGAGAVRAVWDLAREAGIEDGALLAGRHREERSSLPTIRLTYRRPHAQAPQCGDWSEDVGRDRERVHYPDFGCATQRNLAMNVANGRDLQRPQDESPSSSERRYVKWTEYVGQPVSSGTGGSAPKPGPPAPAVPAAAAASTN